MSKTAEHPIKRKLRENRIKLRQAPIVATQRQLARRLDIDEAQLSRYLAGHVEMPQHVLDAAAEALGCQPSELMSSKPSTVAA